MFYMPKYHNLPDGRQVFLRFPDPARHAQTVKSLLEGIPEGKFLVEVSVTNLSATQTDTVLLVYYTAQGQMVGMNYMFANTPVGYTAVFGAAVDNSGGNIGIIRAFVLPTLGNPTPLADGVNEIR